MAAARVQSKVQRRAKAPVKHFNGDGLTVVFTRQGEVDGIFHVLDGDKDYNGHYQFNHRWPYLYHDHHHRHHDFNYQSRHHYYLCNNYGL